MRKPFTLFCCIFLAAMAFAQQRAQVYKQTSMRHDDWNKNTSQWVTKDSARYYYDTDTLMNADYRFTYANNVWKPSTQSTLFTYANGKETSRTYVRWINHLNAYRNYTKTETGFDNMGRASHYSSQTWDTVTNSWDTLLHRTYYYGATVSDPAGLLELKWDAVSSSLINSRREMYKMHTIGGAIKEILEQKWINNAWQVYDSTYITYEPVFNKRAESITLLWSPSQSKWLKSARNKDSIDVAGRQVMAWMYDGDTINDTWDLQLRFASIYDANGRLTASDRQQYYGSGEYLRTTYTYDGAGNVTEELISYPKGGGLWRPYIRTTFVFDANNGLTYEKVEDATSDSTFVNRAQYIYTIAPIEYSDIDAIPNTLNATLLTNPVTGDNGYIILDLDEPARIETRIFDMQGKLMLMQQDYLGSGAQNLAFTTSHLPVGQYVLSLLNAGNGTGSVVRVVMGR